MLNLENLRKQAKQYLRWHHDRYYPVAAAIREHVPRFHQLSDEEILSAEFRLADAQELVARREGFAGWQALRTGDPAAMTEIQTNPQPVLTSVAAHLYVRNVHTSAEFFARKLGFAVDFVYGEPPFYAEVSRDHAKLALRFVEEPVFVEDVRAKEALLSATITLASVEQIKQLFLDYQAADVTFQQSLRNEPWQAKTFVVKDPDGNLILFAGPAN
jgi:uncharacterized glyoxalase superfamily protein PhnB